MHKQNIQIDRLEIWLRGVSPATASAAVQELGPELMRRLGGDAPQSAAGVLRVGPDPGPAELRTAIAGRIAAAVRSRLDGGK